MTRLLIVDGSHDSLTEMTELLETAGFEVRVAVSASDGIRVACSEHFELILLELALPDGSGEHVLHTILRERPDAKIMVITDADNIGRRIGALEMGAVDVIARPFATLELVARVRVRLRWSAGGSGTGAAPSRDVAARASREHDHRDLTLVASPQAAPPATDFRGAPHSARPPAPGPATRARTPYPPIAGSSALAYGNDLWLDTVHRRVVVRGREVDLSQREFVLMSHLISRRGEICTRRELLADVWGVDFEARTNVVDVYIRRLRLKLATNTIDTVRNVGYRLATG